MDNIRNKQQQTGLCLCTVFVYSIVLEYCLLGLAYDFRKYIATTMLPLGQISLCHLFKCTHAHSGRHTSERTPLLLCSRWIYTKIKGHMWRVNWIWVERALAGLAGGTHLFFQHFVIWNIFFFLENVYKGSWTALFGLPFYIDKPSTTNRSAYFRIFVFIRLFSFVFCRCVLWWTFAKIIKCSVDPIAMFWACAVMLYHECVSTHFGIWWKKKIQVFH